MSLIQYVGKLMKNSKCSGTIVAAYKAQQEADSAVKELKSLLTDAELAESAKEELPEAQKILQQAVIQLKEAVLPPIPDIDVAGARIELRPGVGGSEASLFVGDLTEMYSRFCSNKGWKVQKLEETPSATILSVRGPDSYSQLRLEGGVHRVQRVPLTETKGRVHTSAVGVVILPQSHKNQKVKERTFAPGELKIDVMRASGAGGQHVNTTESAVRITHIPTGLVVAIQDERSQHKNKDKALNVLRARLDERDAQIARQQSQQARNSQVASADRSDKIRTYNFPHGRLTDHRAGYTSHDLQGVLRGDKLQGVLDAVIEWEREERLKQLLATESK